MSAVSHDGSQPAAPDHSDRLIGLVVTIVSAHVSHNDVPAHDLPGLIRSVYAVLSTAQDEAVPRARPAVPVKETVFPDYIVCLEDGRRLKMLKRHLMTAFNLTPDAYRARWGLPPSYPMVAPSYASRRAIIARAARPGRKKRPAPDGAAESG